jgi:hypothetical protein
VKKNPKYSKRINYDALAELLVSPADRAYAEKVGAGNLDGKEDDIYTLDPDLDAEKDGEMEVVDEDAGGLGGVASPTGPPVTASREEGVFSRGGKEDEELEIESGKEDEEIEWGEAFEQEA